MHDDEFATLNIFLKQEKGSLYFPCLIGIILKNLMNMLELKQGIFRIVDFDVEEKT